MSTCVARMPKAFRTLLNPQPKPAISNQTASLPGSEAASSGKRHRPVDPGGTLPVDNVFIHDRRFQALGIETAFVPSPLGQAKVAILKYPLAGPLTCPYSLELLFLPVDNPPFFTAAIFLLLEMVGNHSAFGNAHGVVPEIVKRHSTKAYWSKTGRWLQKS